LESGGSLMPGDSTLQRFAAGLVDFDRARAELVAGGMGDGEARDRLAEVAAARDRDRCGEDRRGGFYGMSCGYFPPPGLSRM